MTILARCHFLIDAALWLTCSLDRIEVDRKPFGFWYQQKLLLLELLPKKVSFFGFYQRIFGFDENYYFFFLFKEKRLRSATFLWQTKNADVPFKIADVVIFT